MLKDVKIQSTMDDHVFVWVTCEGRPSVSIDIVNGHGRRTLDVRVNGMGLFGCLLDVKELGPAGSNKPQRYCPMCGEKLRLFSSSPHICKDDIKASDADYPL